jgi:hypothetical protein
MLLQQRNQMSSELDKNLHDAEDLLQRFRAGALPHFINGKSDAGTSAAAFTNSTPIDNSVIGEVTAGNADDIDAACHAAASAFENGKTRRAQSEKGFCTRSRMVLKRAPGISRSLKVMTPGRRFVLWAKQRFAALQISGSSPIWRPVRGTASPCLLTNTSTTPYGSLLDRLA